jgi:glyoxylase-like metal-dependent hydrolase (beta-lactamase superfamily II)
VDALKSTLIFVKAAEEIVVTSAAQQAAWTTRTMPPLEPVRPGLWAIPVPIADSPLQYTLVYALELADGVALVDAGWPSDEAWAALCAGLTAIGSDVTEVRDLLLTHLHPDHYGLAPRIRSVSGARVSAHPADVQILAAPYGAVRAAAPPPLGGPLYASVEALATSGVRWMLDTAGVADDDALRRTDLYGPEVESLFDLHIDHYHEHGDTLVLGDWTLGVHWTPGHALGHVCFSVGEHGVLLAGDHVLPTISPNVSAFSAAYVDPLGDFIGALRSIRDLDVDEVLPAHQFRYRGLAARVDELLAHHEHRLAELSAAVAGRGRASAAELAFDLEWSRPFAEFDGHLRIAAVGETLAHLLQLRTRRRVVGVSGAHAADRAAAISWSTRAAA